eukprot:1586076-Rhodomonas_salina.3
MAGTSRAGGAVVRGEREWAAGARRAWSRPPRIPTPRGPSSARSAEPASSPVVRENTNCLLYTSDAADDM